MRTLFSILAVVTLLPAWSTLCQAEEQPPGGDAEAWASLRVMFVYDGELPRQARERLRIHRENRGIADVCLWVRNKDTPPIHPDYREAMHAPAVAQVGRLGLSPRYMLVHPGQTLQLRNATRIPIVDIAISPYANPPQRLVVHAGVDEPISFPKRELYPVTMTYLGVEAYLFIFDNPYFAVSDAKGELEMKHVPVGTHKFTFFHEVWNEVDRWTVTINGEQVQTRGTINLEIQPGENQFVIKLPAEIFSPREE